MRWGLVPWWATDAIIGSRLINARAETLIHKSAFKDAFRKRRCLVVADGFYEWQKQSGGKTPLLIQLKSERPFGFAGLYETWTPPVGETLSTCTIITTEPNELMQPKKRNLAFGERAHSASRRETSGVNPRSQRRKLRPVPEGLFTTGSFSIYAGKKELEWVQKVGF